ncbi:MAG: S1 RNA-binding domain-containing protein [Candidatus Karelsulcia muelleri]|nr:MAG: S1 RNA-binding domain-containing protein [Candidatus Karelsulcia muelleri]
MSNKNKKLYSSLEDIMNLNKNVKLSDFDWSSYEVSFSKKERKKRKQLEKLYTENLQRIEEFYIYKGKIIQLIDRNVIIDIGFKAEGLIPFNEFRENKKLPKINDIIEVIVEKLYYKGKLIISYNKAKKLKSWERIQNSWKNNEIIIFFVTARTKGGLIVVLFGIECFLPGSQIEKKPVKDFDYYVGQTMEGKIVKINNKTKNVVVSHKILLEKDLEKKKLISQLEKGQILRGIVKNLTHYGSFLDVGGGIDGFCHITDISWERIDHPSEKLEVGQIINFVILSIDKIKNRVQLGLKQLQTNPWINFENKLKKGKVLIGTVSVVTDYGAFVELFTGVEGLVHVSEMSWHQQLKSAKNFVKIGEKVKILILNLEHSAQKMSLSMKRLSPDPWENIENKYPLGTRNIGTVKSFTNCGVRLELEPGIEGLLYNSDISWTEKIKSGLDIYKKGDLVQLIVLGLDVMTRKLNFGCKQLTKNPWENLEQIFPIGSIHIGKIIKVFSKGVIVKFNETTICAFAPLGFIIKKSGILLKPYEEAEFKILELEKNYQRFFVSHSSIFYIFPKSVPKIKKENFSKSSKFELDEDEDENMFFFKKNRKIKNKNKKLKLKLKLSKRAKKKKKNKKNKKKKKNKRIKFLL